ncbi:MAG: O-antigen ligase family protein [Armatimonadota bacterium]
MQTRLPGLQRNRVRARSVLQITLFDLSVVLLLCTLLAVEILDWFFPEDAADRTLPQMGRLLVTVWMGWYVVLLLRWRTIRTNPVLLSLLLIVAAYMLYFLFTTDMSKAISLRFAQHLFPIIGLSAFFCLAYRGALSLQLIEKFALLLILLYSVKILSWLLGDIWIGVPPAFRDAWDPAWRQTAVAYISYRLVWAVPLLLIKPSRHPLWVLTLILGIAGVLLAMQRGTMLALTVLLALYAVKSWHGHLRHRLRLAGAAMMVGLVIVLIVMSNWQAFVIQAQDFTDPETAGSGRGPLYHYLFQQWWTADLGHKVLGHGFYTVSLLDEYAPIYVPNHAHNDWLQFLHDYGLVGITLFLFVQIGFIRMLKRMQEQRSPYFLYLLMLYTSFALITFVDTMMSGVNSFWLFAFMGSLLGLFQRSSRQAIRRVSG